MDRIARWEWHGNGIILVLLCIFVFTIPIGVVYFITNLLRIETSVSDGEKLSEFLRSKK